jgi:hypothetical protein
MRLFKHKLFKTLYLSPISGATNKTRLKIGLVLSINIKPIYNKFIE